MGKESGDLSMHCSLKWKRFEQTIAPAKPVVVAERETSSQSLLGAGEMAQWAKTLATTLDNLNSIPRKMREPAATSYLLTSTQAPWHGHTHTHTK